jgi:hypothetical protein
MPVLIKALYTLAVLLLVAGIVIYSVFRDKTIDEARGMLSTGIVAAVSWPVRFIAYRSGHGRHTVKALAA